MSDIPQITIYYSDGRPSEVRDMTLEELAEHEELVANFVPKSEPIGE